MEPSKYPLARAFEKWITEHADEFGGHEPRLVSRRKGFSNYIFKGVTKALGLHFGENGNFMVVATYRGTCWDILIDFDFVPHKTRRGYVCDLCKGREVYPTEEELIIEHAAKPLAEWVQESFRPGNWLVLTLQGKSSTSAVIAPKVPHGSKGLKLIFRRNRAYAKSRGGSSSTGQRQNRYAKRVGKAKP